MRVLLPLLLLFSLAAPLQAQRLQPITLPTVREAGQTARYVLTRTSEERAGGQVVQSIQVTVPLATRVESAGGDGARETWRYGALAIDVEGGVVGPRLGAATAFGIVEGLTLSLESEGGEAGLRLLSPHAARGAFLRTVRADEDRPGAFANLQAVALREDFRDRVADPAALANLVLDEPRLLRLLDGRTLPPGETLREDADRDSPLTGAAVRTTVTTRLDSLSRDRRTAYVAWRAKADRDALIASLQAVLDRSAPGQVDPGFIEEIAPTLLLEERAQFVVDVATGRVRHVDYTKTARVAGRERIERTTFREAAGAPNAPASEGSGG